VLHDPSDFYDALLEKIGQSQRRITLASLYLGTGAMEQNLIDALHDALQRHDDLTVQILLDYSRGRRKTRISAGNKGHGEPPETASSVSLLTPLVINPMNAGRVSVDLVHMPQLQGWKQNLPSPFDETVATQHLKVCFCECYSCGEAWSVFV
jgi:CDP-diacylglycerol--glycerol-3-phosphate 3-phosphatidyltransferase